MTITRTKILLTIKTLIISKTDELNDMTKLEINVKKRTTVKTSYFVIELLLACHL